jgi:hypothetical protein
VNRFQSLFSARRNIAACRIKYNEECPQKLAISYAEEVVRQRWGRLRAGSALRRSSWSTQRAMSAS